MTSKVERHTLALTAPFHPPLLGQGYGHLDLAQAQTRLLKFLICSCQENLLLLLSLLVLTHERLEVKFTNFGRVDHLWPHKAGDCVYL